METIHDNIKIEPNAVTKLSIGNIKEEQPSDDVTIIEVDDRIFKHSSVSRQHEKLPDIDNHLNIDGDNENFVFVDEIFKEEPVFYDSNNVQILQSLRDVAKQQQVKKLDHRNWPTETKVQENRDKNTDSPPNDNLKVTKRQNDKKSSVQPTKTKSSADGDQNIDSPPNDEKKIFKCDHCSETFQHEWIFKRHQTVHGIKKSFDCRLCAREFASRQRLTAHERLHTGKKPFECKICCRRYNKRTSLKTHESTHNSTKSFGCDRCNVRFHLKCQLDRHNKAKKHQSMYDGHNLAKNPIVPMEFDVEIRIFECYLCHIQYYKQELPAHIKATHCGEKVHVCQMCGKKFATKHYFDKHIAFHSAERQLQCLICGRHFLRKDALKQHIDTHVTSYQCKFCPKTLSTKAILKTHLRTHTGLRPFECEFCNKTFLKRGDMVRHKRVHTGERPFKCNICQKTFTRNHLLTEHKQNAHG